MQSLEVISLNIWHILISLCNLLILFLILKHFLYRPVKKAMKERQSALDSQYQAAKKAQEEAQASKMAYAGKLQAAEEEAEGILSAARENAEHRSTEIVADAKQRASELIQRAENEAALEKKKAASSMKQEIVNVSVALTEHVLARTMDEEEQHALVHSLMEEMGDDYGGNE